MTITEGPAANEQGGSEKGTIKLTIDNLRNDSGKIRVVLFDSESGFPGKHKLGYMAMTIDAALPETTVAINDVPYGEYAVAILHDENENGKMDTNLVGIPKEGYGVSNNAKATMFGPPMYKDAAFDLNSSSHSVSISMVY